MSTKLINMERQKTHMNTIENNIYVAKDLGCAYRWNAEYKVLEFAPLSKDGSYDFSEEFGEGGLVEESLVGDEIITFNGSEQKISDVFRFIEKALGVK